MSDLVTAVLGLVALVMRQTNIFWIVVWMGGLETVHAVKTLRPERASQPWPTSLVEQVKFFAWRCSMGDVHDPPLNMAWPDDMLRVIIGLAFAALCNPVRVIRQIWPYLSVLVVFTGFVWWNGGVVLGDKSNHVATLHLAQLLYIWPLFAFFSFPLLLPLAVNASGIGARLNSSEPGQSSTEQRCITATATTTTTTSSAIAESGQSGILQRRRPFKFHSGAVPQTQNQAASPSQLSPAPETTSWRFCTKVFIWAVYHLTILAASLGVIKYNTIVHPFTLADNRHYMFYIFRYTIRRGGGFRLLLVLPYTVCRWMIWSILEGRGHDWARAKSACSLVHPGPFISECDKKREAADAERTRNERGRDSELRDPLVSCAEPVPTSTALVLFLTTCLSLMTAPLVEPRYFILPWVMWRLLVPARRLPDDDIAQRGSSDGTSQRLLARAAVAVLRRRDLGLFSETLWFLVINGVTGCLFIVKPYVWRDETGQPLDEGRLQRFMW
ncbi:uncharacterized protein UV8b_04045 [Ustilaginoidea virens]|uniref:Dol-P-Glc:Glc(2)Man(9)GlcNAc(2)-PP-Dol alpha-1,2-glucosyltransferase n=1 Tax=Ustilaginoidea virens TaxID=1159556 RepID=A0A8E5HQI0_USTVR|nr:uncharacterized protein UV8b_04045 [Ustilaginoidea virens]QUC19804.1 hypothetical protein UV8b_04045 [Ustilaginoidea virens]